MKGLLFDENLPRRLTFTPSLPIIHATDLGPSPTDTQLWQHAIENQWVIVSKDADFSDRIMLQSPPPWVVHLRFGNLRLAAFHELLQRHWPLVEERLPAHKLVCLYPDRIEAFRDE
jgi:predicted nuclease of predicted toxin-antitoxin system